LKRFLVPSLAALALAGFALACAAGTNAALSRTVLALPADAAVVAFATAKPSSDEAIPTNVAPDAARAASQPRSVSAYIDRLLAHNIFDSTSLAKEAVPDANGDEVVSDLKVKLLATMVASPASFSMAYLEEEGKEAYGSTYMIGDKILDATLIVVRRDEVVIRRGTGVEEIIRLNDETPKTASTPGTAAAPANDADGIAVDGENKYTVSKELVDSYLNDMTKLQRMGRAIPHRGTDGNIDGYRLSGIRRGTVGEKLGIQNGDIVHKVNGYDLSSMSEAMKAFSELQNEPHFSFEVTRRGQRQTMEYNVR